MKSNAVSNGQLEELNEFNDHRLNLNFKFELKRIFSRRSNPLFEHLRIRILPHPIQIEVTILEQRHPPSSLNVNGMKMCTFNPFTSTFVYLWVKR